MTLVLVLGAAYLLGSTPSSYLVVRWMTGRDIRDIGSGNPGTMNVLDHVGLLPAVLVGAGDIGKGVAAVLLAYLAGLGDGAAVFAALLVVAGHDWSIFLRLGGGNGTGPTVGVLLALLPVATLISTVVAFLVWRVVGSRRLGGLTGLLAVTPFAYALGSPQVSVVGAAGLIALVFVKVWRVEGFALAGPQR